MKHYILYLRNVMLALLIAVAPAIALVMYNPQLTSAADFSSRSIRLSTSVPGAVSSHAVSITYVSNASIGSLAIEYCGNSPIVAIACVAPTGFNSSSVTLSSQTGVTGYTIHGNTTANRIVLTRPAAVVTPGAATYQLNNIGNPTTVCDGSSVTVCTFYARISVYSSTDGTGSAVDQGSVALSTAGGFNTVLFVPPYLRFCVGITVELDCSSATGGLLSLGELSKDSPSVVTSQFSGSTNDPTGYNVFILGTTMTAGNDIINPMASAAASSPGTQQFGINLRANSDPTVGSDPTGAGTSSPVAGYNTPNVFKFAPGDLVAQSPLSTEYNRMTVSYLVNIDENQPAGRYSTTLTYLAVAAF